MEYFNITNPETITAPITPKGGRNGNNVSFMERYEEVYLGMKNNKKWRLSTGKYVEDGLHDYGTMCDILNLCHLYIIDPEDENYVLQGIFTVEELKEIKEYKPVEFPDVNSDDAEYLMKYENITNTTGLRNILAECEWYNSYDEEEDGNIDWIHRSIDNILVIYENNYFSKQHNRNWYYSHVWLRLLSVFENINGVSIENNEDERHSWTVNSNGLGFVYGEENKSRKELENVGFLCVESASMMKAMLYELFARVLFEENAIRNFYTIGITTDGLDIYFEVLDSPKGYACRIERDNKCTVPANVEDIGSGKLFGLISCLLVMKALVQNSVDRITVTPSPK